MKRWHLVGLLVGLLSVGVLVAQPGIVWLGSGDYRTVQIGTDGKPAITITPTQQTGFADGTAGAPGITWASDLDTGIYHNATANTYVFTSSGSDVAKIEPGYFSALGVLMVGTGADTRMASDGAGILALKNAANAQEFRVYGTTTGNKYLSLKHDGTNSTVSSSSGSTQILDSAITVGTAGTAPTGGTVAYNGAARYGVFEITLSKDAFVCNAVTCDVTIATLPAQTKIVDAIARLDTQFACASVCTTGTLSMVLGKGSGGAEYLASFDADAAVAVFGDADAERGTLLTRAAAIGGGDFPSWTATQAVVLRMTSGTGNIGNGSVTNLSGGSVLIHLVTVRF